MVSGTDGGLDRELASRQLAAPQQTAPQPCAAAHRARRRCPRSPWSRVRGSAAAASHPVAPRRWSLRARLIALVVATAAVALVAVDIVLPLLVRDAAIATKDATLTGVITAAKPIRGSPRGCSRT